MGPNGACGGGGGSALRRVRWKELLKESFPPSLPPESDSGRALRPYGPAPSTHNSRAGPGGAGRGPNRPNYCPIDGACRCRPSAGQCRRAAAAALRQG